mmetsp:Transcript_76611/g.221446  ORF Transcript_76611/g.221446 Transcript_76611/m.221446 type:complete len:221 (+) Transcript_76611:808-1470(+)
MQLPAGDELSEHVDAFARFERFDEGHDKWMIVFGQQSAFTCDFFRNLPVVLLHALQCISHVSFFVLHQPHDTCRAFANDPDVPDILDGQICVLQTDSLHQLLLHVALHDLREGCLLDRPKLGLAARDLDCGGSWFVEKEGPLAEVSVFRKGPDLLSVNAHCDLPPGNDKEGRPDLALFDDMRTLPIPLEHKCLDDFRHLLLGQMPEDVHLFRQHHLSGIV